jgi:DNA-binding NarL/FixJ family response regulator
VLLADRQGLVRAGFRLPLDATERISVVGEAASGDEPVAHRLRPDVAQAARLLGCLSKRLHPRGAQGRRMSPS